MTFRHFSTKSKIIGGTLLLAGATLLALDFVPSAYILLVHRRAAEPVQGTVVEAAVPA